MNTTDTDFDANAPISEVRLMTPAELQARSDQYQRDAIAGSHDEELAEDLV